jgi:hypothetical protein
MNKKKMMLALAVLALTACGSGNKVNDDNPYAGAEGQKRYCQENGWTYVKPDAAHDSGHCEL